VEAATTAPTRANKAKIDAKQGKKARSSTKSPSKAAKKPKPAAPKPAVTSDGSKKATVLGLLQRKGGATLSQIMKATGWQAHSVRGFISGALGKKMGLTVDSVRRENGERVLESILSDANDDVFAAVAADEHRTGNRQPWVLARLDAFFGSPPRVQFSL
jgi:hypothetical protein